MQDTGGVMAATVYTVGAYRLASCAASSARASRTSRRHGSHVLTCSDTRRGSRRSRLPSMKAASRSARGARPPSPPDPQPRLARPDVFRHAAVFEALEVTVDEGGQPFETGRRPQEWKAPMPVAADHRQAARGESAVRRMDSRSGAHSATARKITTRPSAAVKKKTNATSADRSAMAAAFPRNDQFRLYS